MHLSVEKIFQRLFFLAHQCVRNLPVPAFSKEMNLGGTSWAKTTLYSQAFKILKAVTSWDAILKELSRLCDSLLCIEN